MSGDGEAGAAVGGALSTGTSGTLGTSTGGGETGGGDTGGDALGGKGAGIDSTAPAAFSLGVAEARELPRTTATSAMPASRAPHLTGCVDVTRQRLIDSRVVT